MTRIVAGTHRGRRLQTPPGEATRPTSDRVREAFFSQLASWAGTDGPDVATEGLTFVDLWAGSGAMGLEAASRGASQVICVEKDRKTAELIRKNSEAISLPMSVRAVSVESFLAGPAPFAVDVMWGDPPYPVETEALEELLPTMASWLAPKGLVVLERARRSRPPLFGPDFHETWERRYGETVLYFGMTGE